jgi:trigger factor
MQVTVESTGTLERKMRVELPVERIQKEVDTRLKSVGKTAKIKGFRPGKVPANVVKQRYGKQIRQEVLAELMQKSYTDALVQENLNPAGSPKIEEDDSAEGSGFAYTAILEVMPEVELKGLDKIAVERPEVSIEDKDLDAMIDKLRQQKATWSAVDRASKTGDRVVCDFTGKLKDELIEGGQGTNVPVILGEGQMLPDFEKGLTGVTAGDEKTFKVKFPKDYQAEDLQGQKVDFSIVTHSVEETSLPPVDDALADMFNVEEGGLKQFRQDVRENMEREAEQKVKGDVREQVMNGLIEANPIEIPQTLKQQEMHSMQHDAMRRLGVEDHDQAPPIENFSEMADKRVRLGLLIRQLIADQSISLDQTQVRAHVEEICAGYENIEEMVEMYMGNPQFLQQVEPMVLEQSAIEWLIENGKAKTKKVSFTDYMSD